MGRELFPPGSGVQRRETPPRRFLRQPADGAGRGTRRPGRPHGAATTGERRPGDRERRRLRELPGQIREPSRHARRSGGEQPDRQLAQPSGTRRTHRRHHRGRRRPPIGPSLPPRSLLRGGPHRRGPCARRPFGRATRVPARRRRRRGAPRARGRPGPGVPRRHRRGLGRRGGRHPPPLRRGRDADRRAPGPGGGRLIVGGGRAGDGARGEGADLWRRPTTPGPPWGRDRSRRRRRGRHAGRRRLRRGGGRWRRQRFPHRSPGRLRPRSAGLRTGCPGRPPPTPGVAVGRHRHPGIAMGGDLHGRATGGPSHPALPSRRPRIPVRRPGHLRRGRLGHRRAQPNPRRRSRHRSVTRPARPGAPRCQLPVRRAPGGPRCHAGDGRRHRESP